MLKLRLKRLGKKREPSYRIVVAQSTSRRDGRPVAEVGFYNPRSKETRLDMEAIKDWISKGAQPTETVSRLLKKAEG
jgi:small subunit ribosomal protein S16